MTFLERIVTASCHGMLEPICEEILTAERRGLLADDEAGRLMHYAGDRWGFIERMSHDAGTPEGAATYDEGGKAFVCGVARRDNPHLHLAYREYWFRGWDDEASNESLRLTVIDDRH